MALALFDLDQTLINGDSDFLWGDFLSEIGAVDAKEHQTKNKYFFDQYKLGKLDIDEYLDFALKPLSQYPLEQLNSWHQQFMQQKIAPILLDKAQAVIDEHKNKGDTIIIITATNDFITRPIANAYGVKYLIATKAEKKAGKYTGKFVGVPCFQSNKITKLKQWLDDKNMTLQDSYFYSDSYNDLSLLKLVDHPIVVHGDEKLLTTAKNNHWQTLSWK